VETEAEHAERTYSDLLESRARLQGELGLAPTVLNWPYGVYDSSAVQAARTAGFSHFLLYGGNSFATFGADAEFVPRMSVTRIDESLPLAFPSDAVEAQRWWLAFLRTAWWTRSPFLLSATLAQLDPLAAEQPRAEVARAAAEWLWGDSAAAKGRLDRLRRRHPGDATVAKDIDELNSLYQGLDG
jgi:hypothetical protein